MRTRLLALVLFLATMFTTLGATLAAPTAAGADTAVGSTYLHPSEYTPLHNGALELGLSDSQYQKSSVGILSFIFGIAGVTSQPAPAPGGGNHTITTSWTPSEIVSLDHVAGVLGLSRSDAQKVSSMVIAFLLALS